jgi:hypothetical protein
MAVYFKEKRGAPSLGVVGPVGHRQILPCGCAGLLLAKRSMEDTHGDD